MWLHLSSAHGIDKSSEKASPLSKDMLDLSKVKHKNPRSHGVLALIFVDYN